MFFLFKKAFMVPPEERLHAPDVFQGEIIHDLFTEERQKTKTVLLSPIPAVRLGIGPLTAYNKDSGADRRTGRERLLPDETNGYAAGNETGRGRQLCGNC